MSLDVSIKAKRMVEVYEDNITYNLAPMYYKCIDENLGFRLLDGMKCKDAIPLLNHAIDDLIENKEEYEKLNPKNGWGSYEGLLKSLTHLRDACIESPGGRVEIS